ncbi:MAG: helix-turn-helix domain-containing protein [Pseudomonadota bacterium]|nr:helix-turn-helix domain-containing protein [Pseudomonadota bacterium]
MHKIGILVNQGVMATAVTGVIDVLNVANGVYKKRTGANADAFSWQLIGVDKKYVESSQGLVFKADVWLEETSEFDVVIWPGSQYRSDQELWQLCKSLKPFHPHIVKLAENAELVMSGCTAVPLLAHTGLLADKKITASWWLDSFFQRHIKGCKLDTSEMLRLDGKFLTCGATSSFLLLTWYLVRHYLGKDIADTVARYLLIDTEQVKQSAFFALNDLPEHQDAEMRKLEQWICDHLDSSIDVSTMAYKLNISERTLTRRFKKLLGVAPMQYVQIARIERACGLLKTTNKTAQQIALGLGYQDDAAFRKLFIKHKGVGMGEYRRNKEFFEL